MHSERIEDVWYPTSDYVESVVTSLVPILFPSYDIVEPDFQFLGGQQGRGLLASSLARPLPYFGQDRYPTIAEKAAAIMWSITLNHPFNDGNKRAALATAFAFIANNGHMVLVHQDEAVEMCLRVAANTPGYTEEFIAAWMLRHMFSMKETNGHSQPDLDLASSTDQPIARLWDALDPEQRIAWLSFYRAMASLRTDAAS